MPIHIAPRSRRSARAIEIASQGASVLTGLMMLATACAGALLVHQILRRAVEAAPSSPPILDCRSFGETVNAQTRACLIIRATAMT